MSTWPHDTPAPGRFSLGRVVAARLGHARRRSKPARFFDGYPDYQPTEMAVYDPAADDEKREGMNGYEAMALVAVVIVSAIFSAWALCAFAKQLAGLL